MPPFPILTHIVNLFQICPVHVGMEIPQDGANEL